MTRRVHGWRSVLSARTATLPADMLKDVRCFVQAFMWQMAFMADPVVLKDLEHQLKVDERVLRHMVFR